MSEQLKSPFELVVGDEGGKVLNGDVPVRWCIDPTLVEQMDKDGVKDPHILLLSSTPDGWNEMQRKLVPVGEVMTYVRFTRAGKQHLHAWIVDGADGRKKIKNRYLDKTGGDWNTHLLYDGGEPLPLDNIKGTYVGTSANVVLPAEVFGKEPKPWVKWYANLWHTGRAVDQCNFRQRAILAFTLKWIPFFIWSTILTVIRLGYLGLIAGLGFKEKTWPRHAFKLYSYPIDGLVNDCTAWEFENDWLPNQNYLIRTKVYGKEWAFITFLAFTPVIALVLAFLTWLIGYDGLLWQEFFIEYGVVMSLATGILFFLDIFFLLIGWLGQTEKYAIAYEWGADTWDRVDNYLSKTGMWPLVLLITGLIALTFAIILMVVIPIIAIPVFTVGLCTWLTMTWLDWLDRRSIRMNDITEYRELFCPSDMNNLKAKYGYIPKERRTFRLWYEDLKNKVCKPMQM